jgi:ABC-2 type transport system ATP-binding protein
MTAAHAAADAPPTARAIAAVAVVDVRGLTRTFGAVTAVDRIDLVVHQGEIFGLLGPNGAGKTTTIKVLTTLLPATAGRAFVAGFDVATRAPDVRGAIGYVPQLVSAEGSLTGWENLLISARLHHLPRSVRGQRIQEALAFMGLTDVAARLASTYSGGMVRRLELARAMLHRPTVLFLDEPTIGLDPIAREAVWRHVRDLRDRFGTTVVLTTHYMDEADSLCDRVAIMNRGRVATIGVPADLRAAIGPDASLEEVFRQATGNELESGGSFRDVARTRRTARRLG